MKAQPRQKVANELIKPKRGRKPVEDPQRPVRIWLPESVITELGGYDEVTRILRNKIFANFLNK